MKVFFSILAVLLFVIGVILGLCSGFGTFIYGIYSVVLLAKGTVAVSFWSVAQATLCIILAGLIGWAVAMFFFFLGGMCKAFAS